MKKYSFSALNIEITRRCNKKCPHCMRGNAQNITMSEKIIDRIFCDIQDAEWIILGNGEPLLELERIEYIINKIIESKWTTRVVELTTNGSILDSRLIDALGLFCSAKTGSVAIIRISNDQFHEATSYQQAYLYYTQLANAMNARIRECSDKGGIYVKYVLKDPSEPIDLLYEGKAVDYIDNGNSQYQHGKNVRYPCHYKHRIKVCGDSIPCKLSILANGNVGFDESQSYDNYDALSIGNILSKSMTEIIEDHNENCMLLCSEIDILRVAQYGKNTPVPPGALPYLQFYGIICSKIIELRYKAKELFPYIPSQEIIKELPFPDSFEMEKIIVDMYKQCPEYTPNMLVNIIKHQYNTPKVELYLGAACLVVIANMNKNKVKLAYPESRKKAVFRKFAAINKEIRSGHRHASNDTNFRCNSIDGDVSYAKDDSQCTKMLPSTDLIEQYLTADNLGITQKDSDT